MSNLQNIIEENKKSLNDTSLFRAGGSCWEVCDFEAICEDIKENNHLSQLRLIEGFREMVDKDLEVVLEFVERYNKNDAEKEVAQSALSLKNIKEELNNNEENDNKSF
jgi:Asp-tRNA(Asn)/Glu-tRNA(Gln) amidotransferase C subunit